MATPGAKASAIKVAPAVVEAASLDAAAALAKLGSRPEGLTGAEAAQRLATAGPNEIAAQRERPWPLRLLRTMANPLVVLLALLSVVSWATGDVRAAVVIAVMVVLGVTLRFAQESRAGAAAAKLRAMIRVTATVLRDGAPREVPLREVVPGDVIVLAAGDMVPADVRLLAQKDLHVTQSSLTGESVPAEKSEAPAAAGTPPLEMPCLCWLGTSVASGTARAVVVVTGRSTFLGAMAGAITAEEPPTAFDRGVNAFTWLMIRLMAVMVPLVFLINGLTKHDWKEAFFFALAVAVGLTPEMLPMIVSVCLSKGAMAMARTQVIVKRLNAIQNFGAMDVLCTDKTGTLTMDAVILERHVDATGAESEEVIRDAWLVSHFQTGLRNVMDQAILAHEEHRAAAVAAGWTKVDEIPFDFERKMMSVVVGAPDGIQRLIVKGAPEAVIARCTRVRDGDGERPLAPGDDRGARAVYEKLSGEGFRVLAVAAKACPATEAPYDRDDERDLTLVGYVAFLDPPKDSARPALDELRAGGVTVKILTGDNELVSRTVCSQVGLAVDRILLGAEIEAMDDIALGVAAEGVSVFARLSPAHKQRIIASLRARGHVVGFMGDGINDAPALRAADVGVSVDTAVDVAKESADIILLEKSLLVLADGVREGRKVFSNILKYVRMGASSNFGNMFSVLGASAILPFLPMAPIQVLTNNLLYDFSQVPIPTDRVDPEQIAAPRPWSIPEITRFILFIGPISSLFDYATFAAMWFLFGANSAARAPLFQTGWFVESIMTQTLIIHVIRTNKIPFLQSRASPALMATTALVMLAGALLPYSPAAPALGLVALPAAYWGFLAATLAAYLVLTQLVKTFLLRRKLI
ncbi:MAG TPA: magnesium-translocating P-type ATPase [Gemmatimonadaceae bacterium]|nr:magnesium-translocating P-type ATPase [Gemmatimonadaceae bacterium]